LLSLHSFVTVIRHVLFKHHRGNLVWAAE
jgi:hypothetical protein